MVGPPTTPAPPITEDALPALRREMRKLRRALHTEKIWQAAAFAPGIGDLVRRSAVIGLYAAMSGEPDPTTLPFSPNQLRSRPALLADGSMVFRQWETGDLEMASSWGGGQPSDAAPIVEPDVIFVPLVAFDGALNRVGQGGGHYDRYLAAHDGALRIGVAWDAQRVAGLPVRDWDMPLDAVITEQHCYTKELRACLIR